MKSDSKGPVLAAQFSNEPMAQIASGMLEDNGIVSFVVGSNMAYLYGGGSAWAPINLYVRSDDLDKARELLHQHGDI